MKWANVSFEAITIDWGKQVVVPATADSYLEEDVVIPIDDKGNVFVPFVDAMGNDFKIMSVHALLDYFSDVNLRGNLLDFFEGNFVLIGDVSTGSSDLGDTPLQDHTSLVSMHASILNGLLTNTFYSHWAFVHVLYILMAAFLLLVVAALLNSQWAFI